MGIMASDRVSLVVGGAKIREAFQKQGKVSVRGGDVWSKQWIPCEKGQGSTGQVRRASFGHRSVTLLSTELNRGSAIDFINSIVEKMNRQASAQPIKKLSKGIFLGGGSSDEEIRKLFETVCVAAVRNPSLLENLGKKEEKRVTSGTISSKYV